MQDSAKESKARRTALGIVLGLAVGLLIESALVVMLRATMPYFLVASFGLIVILPIVGGILFGVEFARNTVRREFSWRAIMLLALILWPTTIALPFGAQILTLRHAARNAVPAFPGGYAAQTKVDLGDGENTEDRVHIWFVAQADVSGIVKFYRTEFARRGWEEGPQHYIESKNDDTPYWFRHKRTSDLVHIKFGPVYPGGGITYEVVFSQ